MKAGASLRLRTPSEILATLDEQGSLDGVPFMPEMLKYFDEDYRVSAIADRLCDTIQPIGIREIPDAVILDDLRCDGSAHGGCQAECRLFWKNAWLRPAEGGIQEGASNDPALVELEQRVLAGVHGSDSSDEEPVFRCQHTELRRGSRGVGWWDARSFVSQVTNGNVGIVRFVRVTTRAVLEGVVRRLHLPSKRFIGSGSAEEQADVPALRGLAPGQLVRIRSKEEIERTLDDTGKRKGLWFDREMLVYAGRTSRVRRKIERFVDERTGRIVDLKSDCYSLEGIVCGSDLSDGRWFCPRAIYPWWRECWLELLEGDER